MDEEYFESEEDQTILFERENLDVLYGYVPDHFYMGCMSWFICRQGIIMSEN